ncbi:helix-turn-helix domain-containing protein [Streptomyces althioticus]|uniref:helix-turn-helix domain-containing protein n=1 Tax=Streptomyces althioticus TaxID=83380 RepID=UPI00369999ED
MPWDARWRRTRTSDGEREPVSAQDEVTRLAALLRELKGRTDRSYGRLARRLGMNTSTLHRYCAGDAVPVDFAPLERFAALCGATPEERLDLHRLWLRAAEARRRPRDGATSAPQGQDAAAPDPSGGAGRRPPSVERDSEAARRDRPDTPSHGEQPGSFSGPAVEAHEFGHAEGPGGDGTRVVSGPVGPGHGPGRRRRRRRRAVAAVAAMCAVLATVGSLSFLPDDRKTSGSGAVGAAEESLESGSGDGAGPARSVAPTGSPSASTSPSPSNSPSARHGGNGNASRAPSPVGSSAAPDDAPAGPPLTWSVDDHAWAHGCGHDYVVAKPPAQVPPPPAPQDARTWAATQGAVHGKETLVELSVQGRTDTAVVLTALRVRVTGRSAPASGNAYAMDQGCGGALTPRYFDVDLDKDRPIARAVAGNDAGTPVPAVRMPYRVSATDPEVLLVTARTEGCDCRWWLELDWSSQGRTGTVRIDDRGRPFRTSAVAGLPHYEYDTLNRSWRTRSG